MIQEEVLNEAELYKELGVLTKDKSRWEENIPYVSSRLAHKSEKTKAKAQWLLGEMGLEYPKEVKESVKEIVSFCDSQVPLLRERAVNALGRIGRADYLLIEEYWEDLFRFASDEDPKVRLSFIWDLRTLLQIHRIFMKDICLYLKIFYTIRTTR